MFWRMTGLTTASPVETILDKENYTLEELLDEDEIIQECKALNARLINFLRERAQVEQLIRYIVEEAPADAEKKRVFKFPFIACEIFTCEVDIILKTLVEDEELMDLLFSFLKPDNSHCTLLAGYFSKVVICLMLRKTVPLINYVQAHQEIFCQLVELIGITSIMEVLVRLIGADEHMYSNYMDSMQWLDDLNILEMIVDKFSSSDSPEVHANAAETLCAITRYAPPGFAAKISSPSFVSRLFCHALEDSRPKSVLIHSLTVCICLLDPRRSSPTYNLYRGQLSTGPSVLANQETIDGMLESLGDLLSLLDVSSSEVVLPTTYGNLKPPLGKHRLKIVEFISVLITIASEAAEKELIRLGAIQRILDLFFEYPFNNFLHHHVENIVMSCLESKNSALIEHVLHDCNIIGRILDAEKNFTLSAEPNKPTVPAEGRSPPRIGNIGHLTRVSNKIVQLENSNTEAQAHLQDNADWKDWHTNVLNKRNALENVYQWTCGRPTTLQDRTRDSDDEEFRDRDYDVAALANNLSQAFRYSMYNSDDIEEAQGSIERDDEDVYFDDESAEVVISSLRLRDEQDSSSLFSNSNWFAFEDDRVVDDQSSSSLASPSPNSNDTNEVTVSKNDELVEAAASDATKPAPNIEEPEIKVSPEGPVDDTKEDPTSSSPEGADNPPEWVEWRETSERSAEAADTELEATEMVDLDSPTNPSPSIDDDPTAGEGPLESVEGDPKQEQSSSPEVLETMATEAVPAVVDEKEPAEKEEPAVVDEKEPAEKEKTEQ
ncbi:hypothetical protein QJS04_geneDACA022169 [Acorus gramineus]|uniref:Uncharacterized protein n=1 Tax=Acorus gramineus TaxID=55184 RepID=A0AAV9BMB9_ACOGR|nr:hypothetical protein QJS04_geneDACA022169 [Acorus gramineus]